MRHLFLLLVAACDSSSGMRVQAVPPAAACLSNACAAATDCAMGTRCNTRLEPPKCEQLYCGADGTICDDNVECAQGSACVGGACYSGRNMTNAGLGDPCVNPLGSSVMGGTISSPAVECPSELCLIEPNGGTPRATCTRECSSDGDCKGANAGQCPAGFVCAAAQATGKFACQKFCVCADDVQALSCP